MKRQLATVALAALGLLMARMYVRAICDWAGAFSDQR